MKINESELTDCPLSILESKFCRTEGPKL